MGAWATEVTARAVESILSYPFQTMQNFDAIATRTKLDAMGMANILERLGVNGDKQSRVYSGLC